MFARGGYGQVRGLRAGRQQTGHGGGREGRG